MLQVSWMLLTVMMSIKHIYVVITHDWSSQEDWISITILVFICLVFVIIWSYAMELRISSYASVKKQDTQCNNCKEDVKDTDKKAKLNLSLDKKTHDKDFQPTYEPIQTPEYFPKRKFEDEKIEKKTRIQIIKSARVIQCQTKDGVTTCFSTSAKRTTKLPTPNNENV